MSIRRDTITRGAVSWHAYTCAAHGVKGLPGATTILNKKAKPGLEGWFKEQGAKAAIAQLPNLPAMLEMSTEEAVVKMLASSADKLRDKAGDRGTLIHQAIEHIVHREPVPSEGCPRHTETPCVGVTDALAPAIEGFKRWARAEKPKLVASEFMVISETHGYGATGDLLLELRGNLWLIDVKTSKNVYADTAMQLAAIRFADHMGAGDDAVPVLPASMFGVLHVRDDASELIPFDVRPDGAWESFLACVRLYQWDKEARAVMGQPLREAA